MPLLVRIFNTNRTTGFVCIYLRVSHRSENTWAMPCFRVVSDETVCYATRRVTRTPERTVVNTWFSSSRTNGDGIESVGINRYRFAGAGALCRYVLNKCE
jgi:hypothetical protein